MTLPKSHFYVRTRKDAFPTNPGAHPLVSVKIDTWGSGKVAFVAACSPEDNPCRAAARQVLLVKRTEGKSFVVDPSRDTLASILKAAKVPRKVLAVLDMDRAERAFERSLEA
jgi:hypothetical protein